MLAFENSFKNAVYKMMDIISDKIPNNIPQPVKAYLTGGSAVHFYSNTRISDDVDLILSHTVNIPEDLTVVWLDDDENINQVAYDYTYNPTLGLMHEDFEDRAKLLKSIDAKFEIYLLSPIDLIITKISRYASNDEKDIQNIIKHCEIDKDELYNLAKDTINVSVAIDKDFAMIKLGWIIEYLEKNNHTLELPSMPNLTTNIKANEVSEILKNTISATESDKQFLNECTVPKDIKNDKNQIIEPTNELKI